MLFRKIEKGRWNWGDKKLTWLKTGEIPAAPLSDLKASPHSKISVWKIEVESTNLKRIVAAMAAKLQHLDKFDFAMFSEELLNGIGIQIKKSSGQSADPNANEKWHYDMIEVSANKLINLIKSVETKGSKDRFDEDEVERLIRKGVGDGTIERKRINEILRQKLFNK